MTPNRFNEIVKNRAQQRVKAKIAKFEATLAAACKELHPCLTPNHGNKWYGGTAGKHMAALVRHLLSVNQAPRKPSGYPQALLDEEEEKVQQELLATLATMDEMAKALLAEPDTEPQPIANDDAPTGNSSGGI